MNKIISLTYLFVIISLIDAYRRYTYLKYIDINIKCNKDQNFGKLFRSVNKNHKTSNIKLFSNLEDNDLLDPIKKYVDSKNKWILSYADLSPYSTNSIEGLLFLATNLFYSYIGIVLFQNNQSFYSIVIEIAGLVSMYYHWCQLNYDGPNNQQVIKALIIDYIIACITIILFLYYSFQSYSMTNIIPYHSIVLAGISLLSLRLSWKYEYGLPYMVYHGLWHILSAYAIQELFFPL